MPVCLEQKVVSGRGEGREGTGHVTEGLVGCRAVGWKKRRVVIPCPDAQAPVLSWWGEKRCQVLQRRGWAAGAPAPLHPPQGSSPSTPSQSDSYRQRRGSGS